MQHAAQLGGLFCRQLHLKQTGELRITVLLDHVNAFVLFDKLDYFARERIRPHPQVISLELELVAHLVEALFDGPVRGAVSDDAGFRGPLHHFDRLGNELARGLELAVQAV